jgi:hypothetical protein
VPGLADHRLTVEALDQHPALVVHREVHRADHPVAAALHEPGRRRIEQPVHHLDVVLELQEAEHAPGVLLEVVESRVDLSADPAHHAAVPAGEEELGLAVLEERVEAPAQEQATLDSERGDPLLRVRVQPERELDEIAHVSARGGGRYLD